MSTPTGLDQSWSFTDPATARRLLGPNGVVSGYLSRDPSKNWTPNKVKAYHAVGLGVWLNWEAEAGAPLNGGAQGKADATDWVQQAKALIDDVGYGPRNSIAAVFSCDRDVTPGQFPTIDDYYRSTLDIVHGEGFLNGVYGEFELIEHLHAAELTDVEWQTYAWSGGRLSPEADFYQYSNGQTVAGASVDFNRVINGPRMGVWWPPAHPWNTATGTTPKEDDAMAQAEVDDINRHMAVMTKAITDAVAARGRQTDEAVGNLATAVLSQVNAVNRLLSAQGSGVLDQVAALNATQAQVVTAVNALKSVSGGTTSPTDPAQLADAVAAELGARLAGGH